MDVLMDALLDSIKLLPFLYVVYVLIAYLEGHSDNRLYHKMTEAKWGGPVLGALIGCVPQCGFSVIGSNLYSRKMISLGTLIAIFVSTSDEALPILLSHPSMIKTVGAVLILKVGLAIFAGMLIEVIMGLLSGRKMSLQTASAGAVEAVISEGEANCSCSEHHHEHVENMWLYALKHSIRILLFIFMVNLVLGGIIELMGSENLGRLLLTDNIFQPALSALIGLIPNCAASIVLTEMFVKGSISLGSLIAGLCTGAGVGLVVLFKANKNMVDNLKIVGILYMTGTLCGMLIQFIG